jgi:hypothetical protein
MDFVAMNPFKVIGGAARGIAGAANVAAGAVTLDGERMRQGVGNMAAGAAGAAGGAVPFVGDFVEQGGRRMANTVGFGVEMPNLRGIELACAKVAQFSYQGTQCPSKFDGWVEVASREKSVAYKRGDMLIIGFKGTSPFDLRDLMRDAHLVLGCLKQTERFEDCVEFTKKVAQGFDKENIYFTGHSLGGTLAFLTSAYFGCKAHVFNSGNLDDRLKLFASPIFAFATSTNDSNPRCLNHRIRADTLSHGWKGKEKLYDGKGLLQGKLNPIFAAHSMENFLP